MKLERTDSQKAAFRFLFLVLLIGLALPSASEAQRAYPNLPGAANGRAAIAVLGGRLPEVAQRHGMSAQALTRRFTEDQSLWLDNSERLFFVEPELHPEAGEVPSSEQSPPFDGYTADQAFFLNSKPDSNKVIYLDFDGHLISNTAWNGSLGANFDAPAFDLDGNPSSFSTDERNRIIEIWRRVAEDFAAFDVNVTTQYLGEAALTRSSSTDQEYGTRALITRRNAACSGCGGVAYVGVYDYTGDYYKPAFVFFDALGNGHPKYVAEAVSHEVGHNLGLSHDGASGVAYYQGHGTGQTGWAPIMGNGYYQNVTQWSKGEYSGANNTEDDLAVIQQNGLSFRSDDHGDSRSTATHLSSGATFTAEGIIGHRTDVDYFTVNAAPGEVLLNVAAAPKGPNLDIQLTVFDPGGALIAQSNAAADLSTGVAFFAASEGTYSIRIEGVGYGTPSTGFSDYASLGFYQLSGTLNPGSTNQPPTAVISASATSGTAPLTVSFSGSSSHDPDGAITAYHWTFGDGSSATGSAVQHTFGQGSYQVTLTVTDDRGFSGSASMTVTVNAAPNTPPNAAASATPVSGIAPLNVAFSSAGSADPDGSIASYRWTFGDGSSSTSPNPAHTYTSVGTFTATLTVTDNSGATDSESVAITVSADPTLLAAPSNLSAAVNGITVALAWNDNSNNESGFRVYRGTESGKGKNKTVDWQLLATLSSGATSYSNTGVAAGTYLYRVDAFNSTRVASSDVLKVNVGKTGGGKGKK